MAKISMFFCLARCWNGVAPIIVNSNGLINSLTCVFFDTGSGTVFEVLALLILVYLAGIIYFGVPSLVGSACGCGWGSAWGFA